MKCYLAAFVFFISGSFAFAQERSTLSGKVTDRSSGLPVEGAKVLLDGSDRHSITNKEGLFRFVQLPSDKGTVTVSHISYNSWTGPFSLSDDGADYLEIKLTPGMSSLREVIIEDTHDQDQIISRSPYVKSTINKIRIRREATRDITDFLRSSNNINGIRKGGPQLDPVLRGLKFSQLNVQLNTGQKIEGGCPNRMDPAAAHIEIENVESIDIVKGPYALRFGPMFGGLINIKTHPSFNPDSAIIRINAGLGYESNWNGYKQNLNVYGGNRKIHFGLSGGRKNYGNFTDGHGNTVKSTFNKYNVAGELGYVPKENHLIRATMDASYGRTILFPTLPMDERKDDTQLYSLDYEATEVSRVITSVTAKLYQSDVTHEMDNKNRPFSDTVVAVSEIHARVRGGRFEAGLNMADGVLRSGLDIEEIKKDGDRTKNMIRQPELPQKLEKLWNNAIIMNYGLFTEYSRVSNNWELVGALRLDLNKASSDDIVIKFPGEAGSYHYDADSTRSDFTNVSFSLGVTRWVNPAFAISLALGSGTRSPDVTERFIILLPIGYDRFDYLGNPGLEPETNNQVDLTLKYRNNRIGRVQLNGFYSMINNFITGRRLPPSIQKPLTKDVLGVKQFKNSGIARLKGFELSYTSPSQYALGFSLFASYTYGTLDEVLQYVTNQNGEVIGDQVIENDALTEIPPLEGTAALHWKLFREKLVPTLSLRMVAPQNHVSRASYERASNAFVLTKITLIYTLNHYLNISAGVNNLFDVAYYEHLNRNIIGSDESLYEPGRSFYINLYFNL